MSLIGTKDAVSLSLSGEHCLIENGYIEHIKRINDVFYDQIRISDQKAAYIFTFMLAFLATSTEGRAVFTLENYAHGANIATLISIIFGGSAIFSVISAILVVLPRHLPKSTSLFWGTWPQQREAFRRAAMANDKSYLFDQYLENADVLALLAKGKYRCVTFAFRGLLVMVVVYVILLVAV